MVQKIKVRGSGTFLLELMIAILFFSAASAVCVQVFAKARELSREAETLSEAVSVCSDAAELIRAADGPEEVRELLKVQFPGLEQQQIMTVHFDSSRLEIAEELHRTMYTARIRYLDGENSCIYQLQLQRYFGEEAP